MVHNFLFLKGLYLLHLDVFNEKIHYYYYSNNVALRLVLLLTNVIIGCEYICIEI